VVNNNTNEASMNPLGTPYLNIAELERILQRVEPAALLVPPRILRRAIKTDRHLPGPGLLVPHDKSYAIDRDALVRMARRDELGLAADQQLPETVLLIALPDAWRLQTQPRGETLRHYWRLLFHTRVHQAVARRRADGQLNDDAVRERIARIGATEFSEVRAVLHQEHLLLPPENAASVYEEFAARYLELRYFARDRLPVYFPDLMEYASVDAVLAEDVDADAIFAATRPEGAPEVEVAAPPEHGAVPSPGAPVPAVAPATEESVRKLLDRADAAAARGNRVRAAVLRQRASHLATPPQASPGQSHVAEWDYYDVAGQERATASAAAQAEIEQLLTRLRQALEFSDDHARAWREPLFALIEPAAGPRWPIERRFLYDLQKVCIDHERAIYAVDVVEWIVSWGRLPVKRPLPHQHLILTVKHLRNALHRLGSVRLAEPLRQRLIRLLTAALHHNEQRLRARFAPLIHQALDRVGLVPQNYAERVSRDKLVAELLDRIVERRFLSMGDLRDAIARNQLKLPDLAGPGEFLLGDPLIRANRCFANDLDGIYRRGEIYLRWLQRLSALAFGTKIGRFLTLYFILPFGGAYLTLEAIHHVVAIFEEKPPAPEQGVTGWWDEEPPEPPESHLVNAYAVSALGAFLFLLLHVSSFRRVVVWALVATWDGARVLLYEWPAAFMQTAWVRGLLDSWAFRVLSRLLLKPLLWACAVAFVCRLCYPALQLSLFLGTAAFLVACILYNSRVGREIEEVSTDLAVRGTERLRREILPGLYRLVMGLFRRFLEDVERVLYAVDELLRFRAGDSRWALVWKPALGLCWFLVTYLVRVAINLFVEPTFNPIKHFPVVTVTAKLIVPIIPALGRMIMAPLAPVIGDAAAYTVAGVVIFFVPGLAGFLVWELKENWRLYRSNRAPVLKPVLVGSHGETMLRLLRPGLHSGTLPKLFARLRRKRGAALHRQSEALHHVKESVAHFVERDFLAVLAGSKRWASAAPEVAAIHMGTNRIRFELHGSGHGSNTVCIDFEERAGQLVAGITLLHSGVGQSWLARLQPAQAAALHDALVGFYKFAGVGVLREQVDRPSFAEMTVAWTDWVGAWALDQAGKSETAPLLGAVCLLPATE
jgi:hypothetical protein